MAEATIEKLTAMMKQRGFVFASSEIYGGWEATYDFGPLGAEMLRNLRNLWWKEFVHKEPNVVGLDSAIISHPKVWEASGHVESFSDVMVEDVETNKRYRADHLIEEQLNMQADGLEPAEIDEIIQKNNIKSPEGNDLSKSKRFNNLVEVGIGTVDSAKSTAYLRGETCQPIFYNFKLVQESSRQKIPFGIAQVGKAFRNEIKVGPYIFRTREFEQMELEMFVDPDGGDDQYEKFKNKSMAWLQSIGISEDKLRFRDQDFKERAHYNKVATDLEFEFPFGWKEFQGIHNRGNWDLTRHGQYSGTDFTYTDPTTSKQYIPHVVEYSIGLNRLMLVLMFNAYHEEEKRTVLKLHKSIAPYKAAVFPLVRNKENITNKAKEVFHMLLDAGIHAAWDDRGNIGKRYLSQDEIGTPHCITIDYDTLEDDSVTIRDRDTMEQERVKISSIIEFIN